MKNSGNCRVGPSGELVSDEFAEREDDREGRVAKWRGEGYHSRERKEGDETGGGGQGKNALSVFHIPPTISSS